MINSFIRKIKIFPRRRFICKDFLLFYSNSALQFTVLSDRLYLSPCLFGSCDDLGPLQRKHSTEQEKPAGRRRQRSIRSLSSVILTLQIRDAACSSGREHRKFALLFFNITYAKNTSSEGKTNKKHRREKHRRTY